MAKRRPGTSTASITPSGAIGRHLQTIRCLLDRLMMPRIGLRDLESASLAPTANRGRSSPGVQIIARRRFRDRTNAPTHPALPRECPAPAIHPAPHSTPECRGRSPEMAFLVPPPSAPAPTPHDHDQASISLVAGCAASPNNHRIDVAAAGQQHAVEPIQHNLQRIFIEVDAARSPARRPPQHAFGILARQRIHFAKRRAAMIDRKP